MTGQFYFIDWSASGNSVHILEPDERRAMYDVSPHPRNYGNLTGFSHACCTAFVLRGALRRRDPMIDVKIAGKEAENRFPFGQAIV